MFPVMTKHMISLRPPYEKAMHNGFNGNFICRPQVVPVHMEKCSTGDIKEAFMTQAEEQQMELMEIPAHTDLKQVHAICVHLRLNSHKNCQLWSSKLLFFFF